MNAQEMDDLTDKIEHALNAAMFFMDYPVLNIIMTTSQEAKIAYSRNDFANVLYLVNKGFWAIGKYINTKMNTYHSVTPEFFANIAANINKFLQQNQNVAYSQENLMRCFKLVNLVNESWFDSIAHEYSWQYIADVLDDVNSVDELKSQLKPVIQVVSGYESH